MPIGVIINALSVLCGGFLGVLVGKYMKDEFKSTLTNIFGLCALGMGINSVILMKNMPAVILSLILGTIPLFYKEVTQKGFSNKYYIVILRQI